MTVQRLPGQTVGRTPAAVQIFRQAARDASHIVGVTIDGTNAYDGGHTSYEKYIRGGAIMAMDTTSLLWVPVKRTFATTAVTGTALVVNDANNFRAGDSIVVGSNTAQSIVSIVYSTKTITLTTSITWLDNDIVEKTGGMGQARGILVDDEVSLWNHDKSSNVNATAQVCIDSPAGGIDQDAILGDLTAALEDPNNLLGDLGFDDYHLSSETRPVPGPFLWRKKILAANTTLVAADSGTEYFANAAVTVTLPSLATAGKNFRIRAHMIADANLTVAAPANTLVAFNDATATSVAYSTTNEKIGCGFEIVILPDETFYVALPILGQDSATVTVA